MIIEHRQQSSAQSVLAQSIRNSETLSSKDRRISLECSLTDYPQSVAHPFHTSSCTNLFWSQFVAQSVQNNGEVYRTPLDSTFKRSERSNVLTVRLSPLDSVLTTNPRVTPLDSAVTKNCPGGCGISLPLPHVSTFNRRRSTQILAPLFSSTYKSLFRQLPCFHIYTKRRGVGATMPLSHFGPHSSGFFLDVPTFRRSDVPTFPASDAGGQGRTTHCSLPTTHFLISNETSPPQPTPACTRQTCLSIQY